MPAPPQAALDALLAGRTVITRRCELYEQDGLTPFVQSPTALITAGSVTVDYTATERRIMDGLTLSNSDGLISHDPSNGLWYDKIVKLYRGVRYSNTQTKPRVAIINSDGQSLVPAFLAQLGIPTYTSFDDTVSVATLIGYDLVIGTYSGTNDITTTAAALLVSVYNLGTDVLTISPYATPDTVPPIGSLVTKDDTSGISEWQITQSSIGMPFNDFSQFFVYEPAPGNYTLPADVASGYQIAARSVLTNGLDIDNGIAVIYGLNTVNESKWVHYHVGLESFLPPTIGQATLNSWNFARNTLILSVIEWLYSYSPELSWECQIGEFTIDTINMPRMPKTIAINGRDYSAKLENSDFDNAVSFDPGVDTNELIQDIAANGGITKFRLGSFSIPTNTTLSFDGATDRWTAINAIAEASNIEVFFDAQGYLVTRAFLDPSTSPSTLTLTAGMNAGNNLVDWTETSDKSQLYNRVVVSGTSQDSTITGNIYQGVAENHEPSSPTSIENLGWTRTYYYSSSLFTSNAQCQAYAQSLLSIMALESFELDYSSIVFAWLEAGEIVDIERSDVQPGTPTRFLHTNFTIPLTLGPMSGTAKRITIVG